MELLKTYLPWLTTDQLGKLIRLSRYFQEWNTKINLVSRTDVQHLEERHLLHSLLMAEFVHFVPGTKVLDLGTGGGFPGLPLAIVFPEVQFTLLDATRKKITVVEDLALQLDLKNVVPVWGRVEDFTRTHSAKFDFVLGRAVTTLPDFWALARPLLQCQSRNNYPNGVLYLKGGDLTAELAGLKVKTQVIPFSERIPLSFFETKALVYLSDCG